MKNLKFGQIIIIISITVFIKLKIIIFIVYINSQIQIFHRLKPKVVLNILNHQRSNPTQMMKLLLMKVKVVEVKSESATPQLFIDSTIIKIYLYLYFILKFVIHKMQRVMFFCKKITDINGQFKFFDCLDFEEWHCNSTERGRFSNVCSIFEILSWTTFLLFYWDLGKDSKGII